MVVTGDGNQVAVGHGQRVGQTALINFSKEEIIELLDQAEATLRKDPSLSDDERTDAVADLQSIRAQVAKKIPNLAALRALVIGLGGLASIADIADKLLAAFS